MKSALDCLGIGYLLCFSGLGKAVRYRGSALGHSSLLVTRVTPPPGGEGTFLTLEGLYWNCLGSLSAWGDEGYNHCANVL